MRLSFFVALSLVAATACSSESSGGAGGTGSIPSTFDTYCKGTLKVAQEYMVAEGPSAWSGVGATFPAGTTVLMSESFGRWAAYAFLANGSPAKIDGDFSKGLSKDVDFDSTCVDRGTDRANRRTVLLRRSTFHADAALGGAACAVEAGVVLTGYSFSSDGTVASISAPEIKTACGLDKAYTNDVVYASLILP